MGKVMNTWSNPNFCSVISRLHVWQCAESVEHHNVSVKPFKGIQRVGSNGFTALMRAEECCELPIVNYYYGIINTLPEGGIKLTFHFKEKIIIPSENVNPINRRVSNQIQSLEETWESCRGNGRCDSRSEREALWTWELKQVGRIQRAEVDPPHEGRHGIILVCYKRIKHRLVFKYSTVKY